jgi:hypothetical protein
MQDAIAFNRGPSIRYRQWDYPLFNDIFWKIGQDIFYL